jgi:hypothetical protein
MADKLRRPQRIRAIEANLAAMAERRATAPRVGTARRRADPSAARRPRTWLPQKSLRRQQTTLYTEWSGSTDTDATHLPPAPRPASIHPKRDIPRSSR